MPIRPTEGRLPAGYTSSYFGETHEASGYALISYLTAPLHTGSKNDYVVMRLRDDADTLQIGEYRWSVLNGPLVRQFVTTTGCAQFTPIHQGQFTVVVEMVGAGGVIGTLALRQAVDGGFVGLRNQLARIQQVNNMFLLAPIQMEMFSLMGEPITTRELLEDFRDYVIRAADLTGDEGVPAKMVGAIAYNEMLHRPKERERHRFWWSLPGIATSIEAAAIEFSSLDQFTRSVDETIRERELAVAAKDLTTGRSSGDTSLGVCQLQPQTAAMALGLVPWRQRNGEESRARVDADRAAAYSALPLSTKIDLYNHLRFPKANIALCAKLLARIKNRDNRWNGVSKADFESEEAGMQIVMHEFNLGPTDSKRSVVVAGLQDPKNYTWPDDYGPRVYKRIYRSPVMQEYFEKLVGTTISLGASVGLGGTNTAIDVLQLKRRLVTLGFDWVAVNQSMDAITVDAIKLFQSIVRGRDYIGGDGVDGLVDVPGFTYDWLRAVNAPRWVPMPVAIEGVGFVNYEITQGTMGYFGTDWLAVAIIGAAIKYENDYRATHPEAAKMELNDASRQQGGRFSPHSGHQTGIVCDVRLPRIDGTAGGVLVSDALYDRDAARAQMQAMLAETLNAGILCNDGALITEGFCVPDAPGNHVHDNHIHWRIRPPERA